MARINLFTGSVFGNAERVAQHLKGLLIAAGHEVHEGQADISRFSQPGTVLNLICTSTTGQGELPDELYPLWSQLRDQLPQMPGTYMAVIALGDSNYESFAGGGRHFIEVSQEMGMPMLQEPLFIDASEVTDPVSFSDEWAQQLIQSLAQF
ncbi:flavodoxin domain-containing protein [Pokkaliibacter sp. CJK22405]|uniref:flavodoxin domain-containing protein n=1 Tax=Pokkaliibacter sp. CJK22405 TaxID=3384615 RepID=UPI0039851D4F